MQRVLCVVGGCVPIPVACAVRDGRVCVVGVACTVGACGHWFAGLCGPFPFPLREGEPVLSHSSQTRFPVVLRVWKLGGGGRGGRGLGFAIESSGFLY